jgi:hypothetical protein
MKSESEKISALYNSCPCDCAVACCWLHLNVEFQSKPEYRNSERHYDGSYVECEHKSSNVKPKSERKCRVTNSCDTRILFSAGVANDPNGSKRHLAKRRLCVAYDSLQHQRVQFTSSERRRELHTCV